jgi:hypothetical protein
MKKTKTNTDIMTPVTDMHGNAIADLNGMKDPKQMWVCFGPGYWGKGATLKEAAQRCKEAGQRNTQPVYAYLVLGDRETLEGFKVNGYGGTEFFDRTIQLAAIHGSMGVKLGQLLRSEE